MLDPRTVATVKGIITKQINELPAEGAYAAAAALALRQLRTEIDKTVYTNYKTRHGIYQLERRRKEG